MITDQELDKGLLTLKMIWFAMLASLAIYLFVGLQVAPTVRISMDPNTLSVLKTILYVVAFVTLFATRYIRKLILSRNGQYTQPAQTSRHPVLQKYSTAMIVALAMSESIGIYGLVLFLLGKNTMDLYLPLLISAAAMLTYRPRREEVINLIASKTEPAS